MTNGKRKGSSFERDMSKILSLWISEGKRVDLIWRSNNSGGQATSYKKTGKTSYESQTGDLVSIDPLADNLFSKVCFELKAYKNLQVENLIFNKPSKLREFWEVHKKLSGKVNKVSVLIFKQNLKPVMLMLPKDFVFKNAKGIFIEDFVLYDLVEFMEKVTYKEFQKRLDK